MIDGVLTTEALAAEPTSSAPSDAVRSAPVRIAILDEHERGTDGLVRWIDRNAPEFVIVAVDDEWMRLVRHHAFPADVVLLDAEPKGPVSLAARIRACRATGATVVLVGSDVDADDVQVVAGTIDRDASPAEVVAAVRSAIAGNAPRRIVAPALAPRLSPGELQALRLYADGATTAQAAEMMGVGYETVKTYLRRVRAKYAKLGRDAGRRADLVRRAAEDGFLG